MQTSVNAWDAMNAFFRDLKIFRNMGTSTNGLSRPTREIVIMYFPIRSGLIMQYMT